jgi:DNA-binding CsgD family transcriptional regulator
VEQFLDAPHRVAAGGTAIDPDVVAQLMTRFRQDTRLDRLTERERDVLALMSQGLGNAAVSDRPVVTAGAVHKHIRSICTKLDLDPSDQSDRRIRRGPPLPRGRPSPLVAGRVRGPSRLLADHVHRRVVTEGPVLLDDHGDAAPARRLPG